jgi:hypothetical protein
MLCLVKGVAYEDETSGALCQGMEHRKRIKERLKM